MTGGHEREGEGTTLPLVSVIMATYNCADVLPEALESIAHQTYPSWELIVCDDGSTDERTHQLLEQFASTHPGRVTVLRNPVNRRLSFALNRCLAAATGELVARMDGDDRSVPHRLAMQVEFLNRHPEIDLVGTAMQRFDASGLRDVVKLPASPDRWSMRSGVPFAHATVMVRRHVYDDLGGYTVSPRTVRGQDKDLWFRFLAAGFVGANIPDALYHVREDEHAIRRRSVRTRWNSFRTSIIGYRMLGYPKRWYAVPVLELMKAGVPVRGVMLYRSWQARKSR